MDHGFFELNNNTAECSMRGNATGRKNYMFVGSERGGKLATIIYTVIKTAKLNKRDPQLGSPTPSAGSLTTKSAPLMNYCLGIIQDERALTALTAHSLRRMRHLVR